MALQDTGFPGRSPERSADAGLAALNQAARRLREIAGGNRRPKTRDLVGLLLAHGSRAWRAAQPRAHVRVHVVSGSRYAVSLNLG